MQSTLEVDGIISYNPNYRAFYHHVTANGGDGQGYIPRLMMQIIDDHDDSCLFCKPLISEERLWEQFRRQTEAEMRFYNVEWNPDIVF